MTTMSPIMPGQIDEWNNGPVPGIGMVLMDPDYNNTAVLNFYEGRFNPDRDRMQATYGDNLVEHTDGHYRLKVIQEKLGFDLEYTPLLLPWPPFPGRRGFMTPLFLWALAPGKYFHYASMIPRAKVEGKLFMPGGEVKMKGDGYHEQGRTDAAFAGLFNYWYWTRFFLGDWTFIFPVAQDPARALHAGMRALLVYYKNECVADIFDISDLSLQHKVLDWQDYEPAGREDVPRRALFSARWPGLSLKVEMDLYHQFEAFCWSPFKGRTVRQPAWLQHVMKVDVNMRWKGKPIHLEGDGVFETMLTGSP